MTERAYTTKDTHGKNNLPSLDLQDWFESESNTGLQKSKRFILVYCLFNHK